MTDRDYYDDSENDVDDRLERLDNGGVLFLDVTSKHYLLAVWLDQDADQYRFQYVTPTLNDSQFGSVQTVSDIRGLLDRYPERDAPDDAPPSLFSGSGVDADSSLETGTYDARRGGSV